MNKLENFCKNNRFYGKGPLCVALVVTQHARNIGLPLDPDKLLTESGGQVLGLGKSAVQSVLARHGITKILATEGGRTSRGSIGNMRKYVEFLNFEALQDNGVNLDDVERFWIQKVDGFFAGKPFKIRMDLSMGLRAVVKDILKQAEERQKKSSGTYYAGAVLQHLIGAKLECALGKGKIAHNSFSTSDQQSGRAGDFLIGDVAIHVTTSPGEAVIERCRENIQSNIKPMIVTTQRGLSIAEGLSENAGLSERIDIFETTQFIALNIYEIGEFIADGRNTAVKDLVNKYNDIIDDWETDPSLQIEFRK